MASNVSALRPPMEASARTRERLLEAGERLFADRGYRATSVRDITARAGCNLASVNYHFGGKLALYREVLGRRMRALRESRIRGVERALAEAGPRADLELLLRAFTTAFLEPHLDESRGRLVMDLFSRELLDPQLEAGALQKEMVEPVERSLIEAIRAVGIDLQGRAARRCVQSVVAQLAHAIKMRRIPGAASARTREDFDLTRIADHIVRFSVAGIDACCGKKRGSRRTRVAERPGPRERE